MNDFLWVEKYRPTTIDECILPDETKQMFRGFLVQGEIPNLLLSGSAGVGKTTVAKALCKELGADFYVINGSDEGRFLDTVRIRQRPLLLLFLLHLHQFIRLSLWMKRIIRHQMYSYYYVHRSKNSKRTVGSSSHVIIKIKT